MNLHRFFPRGLHAPVFSTLKDQTNGSLVISGVHNTTAKSYFLSDLLSERKYRNIFWLLSDDKEIYDAENNLPFWTDYHIHPLDHLLGEETKDDFRITETITTIHQKKNNIFLVNIKDINLPLPKYQDLMERGMIVRVGEAINPVDFFNQLIHMGYQPGSDVMLSKGEYRRAGGVINVFPPNYEQPIKIELDYETVSGMWAFDQATKQLGEEIEKIDCLPINVRTGSAKIFDYIGPNDLLIVDDIDEIDEDFEKAVQTSPAQKLIFTSFPKTDETYFHLRYLSVLKYYSVFDLLNDLKDKIQRDWKLVVLTKRSKELQTIFNEERIAYSSKNDDKAKVIIIDGATLEHVPTSFQNPETKIQLVTDKEIFSISKSSRQPSSQQINLEFLTGLRVGDLVVHYDHGIGRFLGIVPRMIDNIHREYLEIAYAENDRLFVPIDQADKISKYVGGEENEPQLSRLGATDWKNATHRVKKEAQKIAKALLELYAKRAQAKRPAYGDDTDVQRQFEASFPYEETPGQMKAIQDVKKDMESSLPMDRLVCGDVGFGKTEVAMRAAFKAVQAGRQVAFISPITILADQHYKSFKKRAEDFNIRIEMLSRFRSVKEQKETLEKLRKGDVDVVIGTHRLLQPDVQFLNLGLVIIDEEQRFGVKQKERFKEIRNHVDILTLTATPIPRTLNLSLNKLRDISTITTPPPGRLPIITEVRRYSDKLIVEAIQREVERGGQAYFLHNRVETIEGIAEKLRTLMPNVKFVVAHGQLQPEALEERIMAFKEKQFDVLVSSTIIENGIDLPNANTLVVDDAENFGLAQLYQLRGRIGRGKTQAYAFFLYQSRQPRLDAKRRLRAIVEASELGSGFQVSMRDLEIRGAGDVLGISQHGTIKVVGVNHFLRMLNQAIEEMRSGIMPTDVETKPDVTIELPLEAYIPDQYIPDTKDKINVYQKLSSIDSLEFLEEMRDDLIAEYGALHKQVSNLFQAIQVKILARKAGLTYVRAITLGNAGKQIVLGFGPTVTAAQIMNLIKHSPKWLISGDRLKIDMKELGFNWIEGLKMNIQYLIPDKPMVEKKVEADAKASPDGKIVTPLDNA